MGDWRNIKSKLLRLSIDLHSMEEFTHVMPPLGHLTLPTRIPSRYGRCLFGSQMASCLRPNSVRNTHHRQTLQFSRRDRQFEYH